MHFHKFFFQRQILLTLIFFLMLIAGVTSQEESLRPRIIVTTDITNEPDDQESLIRLLLYANDFSIEGLIGSTGVWKVCEPATHVIHECIDQYAEVHKNLLLHDENYPTAEYLHGITVTGNTAYGMSAVGFRPSQGAKLIIAAADKEDPRPIWLLAWGGANTIAQAIWTVQQTRTAADLERFISKIRVYDLAAQDDAGAWMAKTFPELFIIRNMVAFKGMSNRYSSNAWDYTRGGDESVVTREWVREHIQENHGPLGELYPDALHIWEGDTPTYFYLMPNGLNDPEQQWQGSWGGRFTRKKQKNVNIKIQEYGGADCSKGCFVNELPYLDYWMYVEDSDKWTYQDTTYENVWCSIFRWRTDFQNDFAARMDRNLKTFDEVNHNPVAVLNGDTTKKVIYKDAIPQATVNLDATGSYDPDKDALFYDWWIYKEAGTCNKEIKINNSTERIASISIPDNAKGDFHVILTLRDDGSPSLTSYRRLVINCP